MREIKFRFWNKNAKSFILDGENKVAKFNLILFSYYARSAGLENLDDYVIQQFTGLKDKNGREIYEGDIVKYKTQYHFDIEYEINSEVIFENGEFFPLPKDDIVEEDDFYSTYRKDYEIIGNIFESPELLK